MCLFALLASSCSEDELVRNQSSNSLKFTASFEEGGSRTYVEESNLLRWTEGDQIALFVGNTLNRQYQFDGETGDNSGTFSIVNNPFGTGNDLNSHYAVYPYASNIKITDDTDIAIYITTTLPTKQSYAENSFGLGANTMVAVTEDTDDTFLNFKNVGGYLKLKMYGNDITIKTITLKGNAQEKIAGNATIKPVYGGEPSISMAFDATETITVDCGDGIKIGTTEKTATIFWIVVPPVIFKNGFTITAIDVDEYKFVKSTSKEISIERNVIKPMAAVNLDDYRQKKSSYSNGVAHVAEGGDLSLIIPEDEKNVITSLKISGVLNGTDIKFIREIAKYFGGHLRDLDLSEASIVEGGEAYYSSYKTSNNVIGPFMFSELSLRSIVLPQNLEVIDNYGLSFSKLTSIIIPDNVETIGYNAFYECTSLTSVTMGRGVTSIGSSAFYNCTQLASIELPDNVQSIDKEIFYNCKTLSSVNIGKGIKIISDKAFYNCISLKSITLPENLTSIEKNAFCGCKSLTSIVIPDDVISIGNSAFSGCTSMVSVVIGNGISTINEATFYGCTSLANIVFGKNVKSIGKSAFNNCDALCTLVIPENITSIGDYAFAYCSSLANVTFGRNVETIGESAFSDCDALSVILFEGKTTIGQWAFKGCDGLTYLEIPEQVVVGYGSFTGCNSLLSVIVKGDISNAKEVFGQCASLKTVVISNNYRIHHAAFHSCTNLTSLTLDASLNEIGQTAFYGTSLTTLIIPENVSKIEYSAFKDIPIKECYCYATTPPNLAAANNDGTTLSIFKNMDTNVVLYVPKNTRNTYKSSRWGTYFTNVKEIQQ